MLGITLASTLAGAAIGAAAVVISGSDAALWLVARTTGLMSYLLLTMITVSGLMLSHPHRNAIRILSPASRLRTHIALTVFTLVFTVIHIVTLAVDPWANVGWAGALLPMGAQYRPVPVTVGLISLWAGVISGLTASVAGRGTGRVWRPLHKFAGVAWIAAWLHGVFAGSDTGQLVWMYIVTGILVVAVAAWRYSSSRRGPTRRKAQAANPTMTLLQGQPGQSTPHGWAS